jgi:hypothetical protein
LLVWANSRSNAFPVGGTTVPSGRVISPVKVPQTAPYYAPVDLTATQSAMFRNSG